MVLPHIGDFHSLCREDMKTCAPARDRTQLFYVIFLANIHKIFSVYIFPFNGTEQPSFCIACSSHEEAYIPIIIVSQHIERDQLSQKIKIDFLLFSKWLFFHLNFDTKSFEIGHCVLEIWQFY